METLTIFIEKIDLEPETITVEYTAITEQKETKESIKYNCNQNFKDKLKLKYDDVNININEDKNYMRLCIIEKVYNSIHLYTNVIAKNEFEKNKDWTTINEYIKMFHLGVFIAIEIGINKNIMKKTKKNI